MVGSEVSEHSNPELVRQQHLLSAIRDAECELERGNVDAAIRMCRELLDTYPGQPGLWVLLAAAGTKAGAHDRAVTFLEKAVSIRPAFAPYLRLLGKAYRRAGRARDAVSVYAKSAFIEPRNAEGLLELAVTSFETGDPEEGRRSLTKAVTLSMKDAGSRLLFSLGLSVRKIGYLVSSMTGGDGSFRHRLSRRIAADFLEHDRLDAAERQYRTLLSETPDDVDALVGLGRVLLAQDRYSEAEWYLRCAESIDADSKEVQLEIADACYRKLDLDEARTRLYRILDETESDPRTSRIMGWVLLRMGLPKKALPYFEACLEAAPDDADACFGMAQSYQALGDFGRYEDLLHRTLSIRDNHIGALQSLVEIEKSAGREERSNTVHALLQRDDLSRKARTQVYFSAAAIEDEADNIDGAFDLYSKANALKDVTFDADAVSRQADRMIEIFSPEKFESMAGQGVSDRRPIFIVGMPRSGSTLIEQVLASHPDVVGGGEMLHMLTRLRDFRAQCPTEDGNPDYLRRLNEGAIQEIAKGYLRDTESIGEGRSHVTDKLLSNVWNLGVIALAFPNSRIIHACRDPLDCCTSIFMRDFVGVHSYAYDQRNLGLYYRIQHRLMDYWKSALPVDVFEVNYEDLVADPESEIRGILAYCDLEWDARCLEFHKTDRSVTTASYSQVRKPIYRTAVGKSARYEKHLGALKDALHGD